MALSRPTTVHYAFASSASPVNINAIPDTPTGSYLASWQQGFPPVTMTPLAGGGSPPAGADFNGVLNALSANVQWANAGGLPVFDSALSTAIGGYPVGAVIALNDGYGFVQCTSAGNTADPNGGASVPGWAPVGGVLASAANLGVDSSTTTANTVVLTTRIPFTAATLRNGMVVQFIKAGPTNSGSVSFTVNGIAGLLLDSSGAALQANMLVQGVMYFAQYISTVGWLLVQPTAASASQAQAQTDLAHFLSPAGLKSALQGSNQSLSPSSTWYQKLPGGLILQGGLVNVPVAPGATNTTTFPLAFPTACLFGLPVVISTTPADVDIAFSVINLTAAAITVKNTGPVNTANAYRWLAIGY